MNVDVAKKRAQLIEQQRFDEAIALQTDRLCAEPNNARLHHEMAWLFGAKKDVARAVIHELKACALDKDEPEYQRVAARLLRLLGDATNAEFHANEASRLVELRSVEFTKAQIESKTRIANQIRTVITQNLNGWPHEHRAFPETTLSETLLVTHVVDSVPNWFQSVPAKSNIGDTAEIRNVGRFSITNPSDVIEKRFVRGMPWELPIVALMRELAVRSDPEALIVEVGANIGAHTVPTALWFAGTVLAIEPEPRNYERLIGHLSLNEIANCLAIPKACSSKPGTGRMVGPIAENPGMARLEPVDDGPIEVVSLDEEIAPLSRPVSLIKIDVEGHEQEVIEGALDSIRSMRPIMICELLDPRSSGVRPLMVDLGYEELHFFRSDWVFFPR